MRKKVQLMVALTILAWATQTLFHQWGFGNDLSAQELTAPQPGQRGGGAGAEKFVPGTGRFAAGATLELRTEATVVGTEVKLKQVCRWGAADDAVFAPLADLVLARFCEDEPFKPVTLEQIRMTLHDAGVNLAVVRFSGPTSCTVARSDTDYSEDDALLEWANAKQGAQRQPRPGKAVKEMAVPAESAAETAADVRRGAPETAGDDAAPDASTLRALLVNDLATRLRVGPADLHVTFNPKDEQALRLSGPQFRFDIQPKRVGNLGTVSWDVQVLTAGGGRSALGARKSQKIAITANARAWQRQVVLVRPLAYKQTIRDGDVTERRILVDSLDDEPLLNMKQVVAQQASREMKPGTVMTARTVQAVPLARTGQFVTVLLDRGGVRVKTVARAMEEGSYGQTIKVKNEATRDVFQVVLTGPQEATLGPAKTEEASAR